MRTGVEDHRALGAVTDQADAGRELDGRAIPPSADLVRAVRKIEDRVAGALHAVGLGGADGVVQGTGRVQLTGGISGVGAAGGEIRTGSAHAGLPAGAGNCLLHLRLRFFRREQRAVLGGSGSGTEDKRE